MTRKFDRVIMVVIDGLGVGSAPDAGKFADQGADTLGRLVSHFRARLQLPTLERLGLGEVHPLFGHNSVVDSHVCYGKARPAAIGKTILEGRWELEGVTTREEFTAFPHGFPVNIISSISHYADRRVIANQVAAPQGALRQWGRKQIATGDLIVFTSGGSDLWITAHETTVSLEKLRQIGRYARRLFDQQTDFNLGQVVTVLFTGNSIGGYRYQWENNESLLMATPTPTALEQLRLREIPVQVITPKEIQAYLTRMSTGLLVTRLQDADHAGSQRNPEKMGQKLMLADQKLAKLLPSVQTHDLLIVTSSYGNDPDFPGTAITREWVPILAYSPCLNGGRFANRSTLADVAALLLENFGIAEKQTVESFLTLLK